MKIIARNTRGTRRTVAVLVASAALLGACSTGSASDKGGAVDATGVKTAEANLAAARQVPTEFIAPGTAFDTSAAKGKKVYLVAAGLAIPFIKDFTAATTEGLESAGAEVVVVDHKSDPSEAARLFDQAIAAKADVIVTSSIMPAALAEPIKKAKSAGIPVITEFVMDPGPLPQDFKDLGVVANVGQPSGLAGRLMADAAIADTGGELSAVGVENSALDFGKDQTDAMADEIESLCPTCKFKLVDTIAPPNWAQKLPSLTSSALADPNVNYLLPVYDDMTTLMAPSIAARNATDRVGMASFNNGLAALKTIKAGSALKADVGLSNTWLGWAAADQVLRVLTNNTPYEDPKVPLRLFDKTNIDSIDLTAPAASWYGVDFVTGFKSLWSVS